MREVQVRKVGAALLAGSPVQLFGVRGMGKRMVLRHALEWVEREHGEGALERVDVRLEPGSGPGGFIRTVCHRLRESEREGESEGEGEPSLGWIEAILAEREGDVVLVVEGLEALFGDEAELLWKTLVELGNRAAERWGPWSRVRLVLLWHVPLPLVVDVFFDPYALVRTEVVELEPLCLEDAVALVRGERPEWSPEDVERLMRRSTGGSPLFLSTLAAERGRTVPELIAAAPHSEGPLVGYFRRLMEEVRALPGMVAVLRALAAQDGADMTDRQEALLVGWGAIRAGGAGLLSGIPLVRAWVNNTFAA